MKLSRFLLVIALGGLCFANTQPAITPVIKLATVIEACERATWEAYRNQQPEVFKALCCPEFYEITADGTLVTLADVLREMPDYVIKDYSITEVVVTSFADNIAMMRYKLEVIYIHKGKDLPVQRSYSNVIYLRRDGLWCAAFYQETPLK